MCGEGGWFKKDEGMKETKGHFVVTLRTTLHLLQSASPTFLG